MLLLGLVPPGARAAVPAAPARDAALPTRAVIEPVMDCEGLAGRAFDRVLDSAARVLSATLRAGEGNRPPFCLARGYVAPTIQFELWLPTRGYTGRYLQGGCGGNCGMIMRHVAPAADDRLAFGGAFAVGFEDSGHVGGDGIWALDGPEVREDFAYRAAHVFSEAAKRIIAVYYGKPPGDSYFDGCSDGGREAMMETQRYPRDFNGVIAGSPAFTITEAMERFLWEARWGRDARGRSVWTPEALQTLHVAVITACDALDGVKDGEIDDPRRCHFDPRTLACRGGERGQCLTASQVEAARKLYQGPKAADGTPLYYGGEPYGAELTWGQRFSLASAGGMMLRDFVGDMVYRGRLGSGVTVENWHFDLATFRELSRRGALYDANDADLAAFRAGGGRLILWQGGADMAAGANGLPDYYQRLRNHSAGLQSTERFARYFIVPGVYHCGGGYIPYQEDFLGPLVRWVERSKPPEEITATARLDDGTYRLRPLYPYPVSARYVGHGDINSVTSFEPSMPSRTPQDAYRWAGSSLRRQ
jgi:Tannase and feruloyl esterase